MTYDEDPGLVVNYGRAMRLREITPELAQEWLATLPGGLSKYDEGKVRRYADMMRNGTFELMQLPVIHRNGKLMSSRNRMNAVIRAGIPVKMYVSDDSCPP